MHKTKIIIWMLKKLDEATIMSDATANIITSD